MGTIRLTFNRELSYEASTTAPANYVVAGSFYSMVVSAVTRRGARMVDLTVSEAHTGHIYTVTVSNLKDANGKPIRVDSVTATITGVGVAPRVSSAVQVDDTHVDVVFNETVEETTSEDTSHYAITGESTPAVSAASLDGDGVTVHLTLDSSLSAGGHVVTVIHVTDVYDNVVDPAYNFANFTATILDWEEQLPASSPPARQYGVLAYDSIRNVVVLFGGISGGSRVDDTWEYNGTTWTQKFPVHAPSPRYYHSICFDSNRGVCVLHGGNDGSWKKDTWEWDGTDWTQKSPGGSVPTTSGNNYSAFDSNRNVVVIWYSGKATSTYEYDGTNFTEYTPGTNPTCGKWCTMAFDSSRNVIVLFGGQLTDATCEWGGGPDWSIKAPAHKPAARFMHAMDFDSSKNKTILFGGTNDDGLTLYNDTWEWDGTDWAEISPATSPGVRDRIYMAFDSGRNKSVLFSGRNATDDTWEYGPV